VSSSLSGRFKRPVDFSYDACWFECPDCGDRVVMSFEDRANGYSRTCRSGHDNSARTENPTLTDLTDMRFSSVGEVRFYFDLICSRTDAYAHRQENRRDGRSGWISAIKADWQEDMNRAEAPDN
jgi:hypothetical protein